MSINDINILILFSKQLLFGLLPGPGHDLPLGTNESFGFLMFVIAVFFLQSFYNVFVACLLSYKLQLRTEVSKNI